MNKNILNLNFRLTAAVYTAQKITGQKIDKSDVWCVLKLNLFILVLNRLIWICDNNQMQRAHELISASMDCENCRSVDMNPDSFKHGLASKKVIWIIKPNCLTLLCVPNCECCEYYFWFDFYFLLTFFGAKNIHVI